MALEATHRYDDIIDLPYHVSRRHPPMSRHNRAAQFMPFAALKGYSTHPAQVAEADGKVRPYTAVRTCLDFNV